MKILKLVLENFANIHTSMNTHKLEIDFSNSVNKICLIIGPNGSGKTSIMSLLNPFASLGNLDVRDSNDLILQGKSGYKEIIIQKNDDIYTIKHFYTSVKDKSHSVKSYILKNGDELNPNGNVTSFKEVVKNELHVELDYLKLIRLGSNVTSMIDLSETERKNFMSKLLDDIGIYLTYYKKINNDIKHIKDLISHTIDKLNRLGIIDITQSKEEISKTQTKLELEQENYGKLSGSISILQHEIDKIKNPELLESTIKSNSKKISKMEKILESKDMLESTDVEYYKKEITKIEKLISDSKTGVSASELIINNYISGLDALLTSQRELEIQKDKQENTSEELKKLQKELNHQIDRMNALDVIVGDFKTEITKSEFDSFIVFLKNSQQTLSKTYEFGKKPIKKIISLLRKGRDVSSYIIKHKTMGSPDVEDTFINKIYKLGINEKMFSSELPCGDNPCMFKTVVTQLYNLMNDNDPEDKEDLEFFYSMELAWENIKNVLTSFSRYSHVILSLPNDLQTFFETENIYSKIENLQFIYDDKLINEYLSLITEYDNIQNMKKSINELESKIKMYKAIDNSEYIKKELKSVKERLKEYRDNISLHEGYIAKYKETISDSSRTLEHLEECKDTFEKYDELVSNQKELVTDWELYKFNFKKIKELDIDITRTKDSINSLNESLQNQMTRLTQYKSFKKDLDKFNEVYDDLVLIKESLSSKKGIPLHYILTYLGNTENITNELLDIAYNGKIYIDKFNITPTEFSIPFYNKGKRLRDVKYASQGELSFLSIALSFALSSQTLSKYNIMLLDEIDGPLDTSNREKFISILENQIDRIDSEQNFLITHNEMFSSYPVDIIDLSFDNKNTSDKYPLANFIDIKKY